MKSNLKKIREQRGYSLQELADLCCSNKAQMHRLEKDIANPTLTTAYGIAMVLEMDVTEIWPNTVQVIEETITVRRLK